MAGLVAVHLEDKVIRFGPKSTRFVAQTKLQAISPTAVAQIATLGLLTGAGIYSKWPRGWARSDLLEVKASDVHSKGVFARSDIANGTVLGAYPGFPRSSMEMHQKTLAAPASQGYCYGTVKNVYLDPTDDRGALIAQKLWTFAETTMAYMNEPPSGLQTNVSFEDGKDDLDILFIANRDISASEELFVDYGVKYDRSGYRSDEQ